MIFLYNILIFKATIILKCIALFHKKIKLFVDGRKQTFTKVSILKKTDKVIWIHAASLGEFEQAIPIIENIKITHSDYKIIITFFSPSGYEIRKNYPLADVVCYLPLDSKRKAKEFIKKVNPILAIFVKYEFWPNILNELKKQAITTILISGMIRKNQLFFKSYGGFMRKSLEAFHHFFVQNTQSKKLLNTINFNNVTVAGDTRFDRVYKILQQDNSLNFISKFKNNTYTVVAGSTWEQDEKLLINYINTKLSKDEKIIIAPHNIHQKNIKKLQKSIVPKTVLYSEKNKVNLANYQVFIIDTIGILTKIYSYADAAYVGGGLKTGLHNILEPATFGVPIVIGNQFNKFKEAVDLVNLEGCISINNAQEFSSIFTKLKSDEIFRKKTGKIAKNYILKNIGAVQLITNFIHNQLNKK